MCIRDSFYAPQGRDLVKMALASGLAVVATERDYKKIGGCWSTQDDLETALQVGTTWMEMLVDPTDLALGQHAYEQFGGSPGCGGVDGRGVPVFGFGASSGGWFVADLADTAALRNYAGDGEKDGDDGDGDGDSDDEDGASFQFAAVNVQIMAPHNAETLRTPTILTVMSRDDATKRKVDAAASELKRNNVPAVVLETEPQRITAAFLRGRFADDADFTDEVAGDLVADLREAGALDAGGNLVVDSREINLDPLLAKYNGIKRAKSSDNRGGMPPSGAFGVSAELWNLLSDEEREDASRLWLVEELNAAYDRHEITHERFGEVLDFFFKHSHSKS